MNAENFATWTFEAEPDPQFLAHLEWQVRTATRREGRFPKRMPAIGLRRLGAAAVILLALAAGAGCVVAAQQLQQSREASLRAAQWSVRCELASVRLRAATAERDQARTRFEAGIVSSEEFAALELERSRLEHARARLDNEAAEVARTGREPSDSLCAPQLAGRDFVRERLEIEALDAQVRVQAAETAKQTAQARYSGGGATDAELRESDQRLKQTLSRKRLVADRLALRAAFLDGQLSPLRAELDDLQLGAKCAAADQRDSLDAARGELARAQALASAGTLSQQELRTAQRRVAECEAALRLAELELGVLDQKATETMEPLKGLGYAR